MPAKLTPMMQQYMQVKEQYPDCILMYRLGDFYEMFFEDALTASKELEIVLTGRDCGLAERAPMCGVPFHAVEMYVNRLISKGYKVAICEQMTDPKESKGLVERDVIRVITPGTVIEESMLSERENNYLAALYLSETDLGMAYCDVSTGGFYVLELHGDNWAGELMDELARIQPTELVANDALFLQELLVKRLQSSYYLQCLGSDAFDESLARSRTLRHFQKASLKELGCEGLSPPESGADYPFAGGWKQKTYPAIPSGSDRYRHGRPQAAGLDRTALTEYCHHQQPAGRSGGPLFPSRGTGCPGQSSFLGI